METLLIKATVHVIQQSCIKIKTVVAAVVIIYYTSLGTGGHTQEAEPVRGVYL